jgi:hypothetical protein
MKLPFRFFRGEFNGAYLYKALSCFNTVVKELIDELVYQTLFQWKTASEVGHGELPIRDEDIVGIGKIAGLYTDRLWARSNIGSIAFAPSHIAYGRQRSERGLMDMDTAAHQFVRTRQDEYPTDIVEEASPAKRIGFVPPGTPPVGYIPMGVSAFSDEGEVLWDNILAEPPDDGTPYTPFYGEKYLIGEEWFIRDAPLPVSIFKELLECMLRIRRNGPTLAAFFEVSRLLVTGVVRDIEIELMPGRYYMLRYSINEGSSKKDQDRLITAWLQVCRSKFKLFVPELRAEP